jgi:hypothetical protein
MVHRLCSSHDGGDITKEAWKKVKAEEGKKIRNKKRKKTG